MKTGYKHLNCGLIGEHLGHSFSVPIHKELADYSYALKELRPEEVGDFVKHGSFDAFNVTIPYKKDVIPFLDEISPEAKAIGAVNTIVRAKDGKIYGYNTDYFGFSHMIELSGIDVKGKKAVVFGKGGASLTVCAVLRDKGIGSLAVFGSKDNTKENLIPYTDVEIIVNSTPVGMFPNNGSSPVDLSMFPNCLCVFDLIYNPSKTALILEAEKRKIPYVNGLPMLVAQAAKAFEFFTGDPYQDGCIERITSIIERKSKNIILVGMPGCGKSTVGKLVADKLNREFLDADDEFTKTHGMTPADCINTLGEDKFRELEHLTLCELGKQSSLVIATGGGAVTREYNYDPLHQNGTIFFIERKLENLARDGRPLSLKTPAVEMYASRKDAYYRFADSVITSNEIIEDTVTAVINKFSEIS